MRSLYRQTSRGDDSWVDHDVHYDDVYTDSDMRYITRWRGIYYDVAWVTCKGWRWLVAVEGGQEQQRKDALLLNEEQGEMEINWRQAAVLMAISGNKHWHIYADRMRHKH